MSSINKVILVGRVGQAPETRYMPNGEAVTNLSIATSETWKDKSGEKQEKTEWHRCTFYRKLAEIAGQYLTKGSMVYVEGRLETRKWTDKSGVERYTTEIIVSEMKMLGGKPSRDGQEDEPQPRKQTKEFVGGAAISQKSGFSDMDYDIPF